MKMKRETVTLVLINLAGILERADVSLLPGVYKEVGEALHINPTGLGSLSLLRSIVQTSFYPLAAYLSLHHDRTFVIALGAFLWAFATFLVAFSNTFFQLAMSRAFNGIGLAIVIPAIQSLVADSTTDGNRGVAFGWLQLTGNFGSIIGNVCAVLIAPVTVMGIPGWRIAFHIVAIASVVVGLLVYFFAVDPRYSDTKSKKPKSNEPFWYELKELLSEAKSVIRVPSFQIIVAQGIFGSFPWSGLFSFGPMWLELIGFSHKTTAILMTTHIVANSIGGLFGGKMGDVLAVHLPNSGRIILSQISAASAIPFAAVLYLGIPYDPSMAFKYGLVMFLMGLITSWNAPATNKPIFAEIVPEKQRTSIYALDSSLEHILSSFAPPIVGILAQHVYGYKPTPKGTSDSAKVIEIDRDNAASLAKALNTIMTVSMVICVSIYSFLYCTYPRDRDRAKMHALVDSELHQIQAADLSGKRQYSEEEKLNMDVEYIGNETDGERLLPPQVYLSDSQRS